jgi:Na+/pantothenate symporter
VAIWTIVSFAGIVGIEFYGGILLLDWAQVPRLANVTIAITLAAVCAAFTIAGGLRGVALADVWLDLFSLAGIAGLVACMLKAPLAGVRLGAAVPVPPATGLAPADNLIFVAATIVLLVPLPLCGLDSWQRGVAWKERTKVSTPLLGGALGIVAVSAAAMLAGFYARRLGWTLNGPPPLRLVLENLQLPPLVAGLIVGGFIATILSTADEALSCCAYALLSDVLVLPRETDPGTRRRYIQAGKFYTGVFGFLAAALALLFARLPEITDVFDVVAATQVVFFFPLLLALLRPRSAPTYATTSLVVTLLAFGAVLLSAGAGIRTGGEAGHKIVESSPILAFLVAGLGLLTGWGVQSWRRRSRDRSGEPARM